MHGPEPFLSAPPARIVFVDDHPLVRDGLAARLAGEPDLTICGQAADADAALELIRATRPDLAIVDVALRNGSGLELVKALSADGAGPRILVISVYEEELFAERLLRAGAHGYLNKQELHGSVLEAVRSVLAGQIYRGSAPEAQPAGPRRRAVFGLERLSDRELQIFERIGRGGGTREIATELGVSVHTVESHREHIRSKLGLRSGAELLRAAIIWSIDSGA